MSLVISEFSAIISSTFLLLIHVGGSMAWSHRMLSLTLFFFSWNNLYCSVHSSVLLLCSILFLRSLAGAFVLFCFLMFVFAALRSFKLSEIRLCSGSYFSLTVLGRFAVGCSRTVIIAASTFMLSP